MTSFIAAGGSGRSTSVIPAVPAASSVTRIAFIWTPLCISPRLHDIFGSPISGARNLCVLITQIELENSHGKGEGSGGPDVPAAQADQHRAHESQACRRNGHQIRNPAGCSHGCSHRPPWPGGIPNPLRFDRIWGANLGANRPRIATHSVARRGAPDP